MTTIIQVFEEILKFSPNIYILPEGIGENKIIEFKKDITILKAILIFFAVGGVRQIKNSAAGVLLPPAARPMGFLLAITYACFHK